MEIEPPFKPEGKEFDASYFPKAMEKDEEIQAIMNDPKMEMKKDANQDFMHFNSQSFKAL